MADVRILDKCALPNGNYDIQCYNEYMASRPAPPAGDGWGDIAGGLVLLLLALGLYLIPAIIAARRKAQHQTIIVLLNITLGWIVIGWFAALFWALFDPSLRDNIDCPFCAETIKRQARVCPHCRHDLAPIELKPA